MTVELAGFVASALGRTEPPTIKPLVTPELRTGEWTRHGQTRAVLGDPVAERLLDELAQDAKRAAQAQGYAAGWAEGRRAAERAVRGEMAEEVAAVARDAKERHMSIEMALDEEHTAAMRVLAMAAQTLRDTIHDARAKVEDQALGLAIHLTQTLLDIELGGEGGTAAVAVRRALQHSHDDQMIALHLSPDDIGAPDTAPLVEHGVRLVADPTLQPGDALVELADGVVDLRISAAFGRIREALLGDATEPTGAPSATQAGPHPSAVR